MTNRAKNILNAVKQIEDWCNDNLQGKSFDVFALQKNSGVYVWHDFVYSAQHKKIFLARGDHGRWGALDDDFQTGMTQKRFEHCMFKYDGGVSKDYTKLREDGNLMWDEELSNFLNCWQGIKRSLQYFIDKADFNDFKV